MILRGRDGVDRDLAGSTAPIARSRRPGPPSARRWVLAALGVGRCLWLLDRPVSNSGRLGVLIREAAAEHGWTWDVELTFNPDPLLIAATEVVATADSAILDRCAVLVQPGTDRDRAADPHGPRRRPRPGILLNRGAVRIRRPQQRVRRLATLAATIHAVGPVVDSHRRGDIPKPERSSP